MTKITIRVCGDYWANPEEVRSQLDAVAGRDQITLDLQFEGPCLEILGISSMINDYCNRYQVDPRQIQIERWDNPVEPVDYTVVAPPDISHFFDVSRRYDWNEYYPDNVHEYLFGFFIGRRTIPRAVIMHHLFHTWGSQNLLSCLDTNDDTPWLVKNTGIDIESLDQWISTDAQQKFNNWWKTNPISSIDQHHFDDQYNKDHNTNQDLLDHYHKFDIEIVAESYTRGNSFFPTEKTVRPLIAGKPMIVYGPKNYLENLKTLGFKTYSGLWDESYDRFEGPDRWRVMQSVIDTIMQLYSEDRASTVARAQEIAKYNQQHLYKLIK